MKRLIYVLPLINLALLVILFRQIQKTKLEIALNEMSRDETDAKLADAVYQLNEDNLPAAKKHNNQH